MKALSMMIEKESGRVEGTTFPSVWVKDSHERITQIRYGAEAHELNHVC